MNRLDEWLPRLVAAWRSLRSGSGAPVVAVTATGGAADLALPSAERRAVVAGAARLTQGLTGERSLAGARYFEAPQLLGAYLLLYWPVSYAQASVVVPEIGAELGDVLDVGSGPGPLAMAALDTGA